MRIKLVAAVLAAVCVLGGSDTATARYVAYPTIHERAAGEDTAQFLHKNYATWRYKEEGGIDCRHGRINRYTWTCRVAWFKGNFCTRGRVRITNEYIEGNGVYYKASFVGRHC